jgi:hypothetical protein
MGSSTHSTSAPRIVAKGPGWGNTISRSYCSMCSENIIGIVNILQKGRKQYADLKIFFFFFAFLLVQEQNW